MDLLFASNLTLLLMVGLQRFSRYFATDVCSLGFQGRAAIDVGWLLETSPLLPVDVNIVQQKDF